MPTTRFAIGAEAVFQRLTISVCTGSALVRSTRWLVDSVRLRRTSPVRRLMVSVVSVTTRPKEDAEVTIRSRPFGSGMLQT